MAAQTRRESGAGAAEDSIAAAHLLETYLLSLSAGPGRGSGPAEQSEGET
jgi:hypothetical protein